jgi:hypothetical protein
MHFYSNNVELNEISNETNYHADLLQH